MKKKLSLLLQKIRNSKFFKIFFSTCLIFAVLFSCVVISSSAEDVPEPEPERITNLAGYEITMSSNVTVPAGFLVFDLIFRYDGYIYSQFCAGFSATDGRLISTSNSICFGTHPGTLRYSNPSSSFSIVVSGGLDSSHPDVISWFYEQGASFELVSPALQDPYRDDSFNSIAPISFTGFEGPGNIAVAFPDTSETVLLNITGNTSRRNYLDNSDYHALSGRIKTMFYGDQEVPYIQISLACYYSLVTLRGATYSGSLSSSNISNILTGVTSFEVSAVSDSHSPDTLYWYTWNIILDDSFDYDQVYNDGFYDGVHSEEAHILYYSSGYSYGYEHGLAASGSEALGSNLLGDTLSAPMKALNNFIIYETSSGFSVTLGGVVGAAISLTLFIAFLKIFAGG